MIHASGKLIIVADHTKFGRGTVFHLAPLHMADVVVSDVRFSQSSQRSCGRSPALPPSLPHFGSYRSFRTTNDESASGT